MRLVYKQVKRGVILLVGITVLLIGAAMIVLPGPGIAVLIIGLAILATEFVWAERVLGQAKQRFDRLRGKKPDQLTP